MNHWLESCLVISFTLIAFVRIGSGALCTIEANKCTTADEWQSNLKCRILGSFNSSGFNQGDGYIIDSTNIQTNDTFSVVKSKMRATRFYANSIRLLEIYYPRYNENKKNRLLESIEKQLVSYNILVYGALSLETSQCAVTNTDGSRNSNSNAVTCADRKDNPPDCPVGTSTTTNNNP